MRSAVDGSTKCGILGPPAKLRMVRYGSMVYWGDRLLHIGGKQFEILYRLAEKPREIVLRKDLYALINSERHKNLLLRHYINNIRKAFPPPYSDPYHPNGIIQTRKTKGYFLNLPPDQVEIV